MKLICLLIFSALLISCNNNRQDFFTVKKTSINKRSLIEHQKQINYSNRSGYRETEKGRFLINLSKSNKLVFFNLDDGSADHIETGIGDKEIDAIRYETDSLLFIINKVLYSFNVKHRTINFIDSVPLLEDEFILHNSYSETIFRYKDLLYCQYGINDGFNYIDSTAFLFFSPDTSNKDIPSPIEFKNYYIHYNDASVGNINDNFYYSYSTIPRLFKHDLKTKNTSSFNLDTTGFLKYDTTKYTDMRYLHDYSHATTFNIKLLCGEKYIHLVQRYKKGDDHLIRLLTFDTSLKLLSSFDIDHTVDLNFIFYEKGKIIFITSKENSIYEYSVN